MKKAENNIASESSGQFIRPSEFEKKGMLESILGETNEDSEDEIIIHTEDPKAGKDGVPWIKKVKIDR